MMLPAIAILSAAVLAYEVLLMRLLAIVQWHHFAYMVISIALLGFGASGSFLFLTQKWLKPRFIFGFAANALLFGASALAGFALSGRVPFNALEVVWDPGWPLGVSPGDPIRQALSFTDVSRRPLHPNRPSCG